MKYLEVTNILGKYFKLNKNFNRQMSFNSYNMSLNNEHNSKLATSTTHKSTTSTAYLTYSYFSFPALIYEGSLGRSSTVALQYVLLWDSSIHHGSIQNQAKFMEKAEFPKYCLGEWNCLVPASLLAGRIINWEYNYLSMLIF